MKKTKIETGEPETTTTEAASETAAHETPAAPDARRTIEHWRAEFGTPDWLFAGTKLGKSWPIGKEVTRAEYEAAVEWAANVTSR